MNIVSTTVLFTTPYLELVVVDYIDHNQLSKKWYGVRRVRSIPAVAIAALTKNQELIFVKQGRPMVGDTAVELPAGLMDKDGETVIETASRELLEETGYAGDSYELLVGGSHGLTVTSGITNERLFLVLALDVEKVAEPLTDEGTIPVLVPLSEAFDWAHKLVEGGTDVDFKLFGTIRLVEKELLG